ncbi:cerebellar degeneration-related protein 2-like [Lineus longissimus]|uniref:cerebellar degeneration-related protein 2-like n=1 Tax=Lineus longissimus TaxID=88925 RepID=UPI002B4C3B5C
MEGAIPADIFTSDLAETLESDENYWYQNELQLAAELGKTLLERNRELETQLAAAQQLNHDQTLEIDFLAKQIETLRELNQSKMRVYEEVDKNSQEIEKINQSLQRECKADKEKIKRLIEAINGMETKCESLQNEVETLRQAEREAQQKPVVKRRTKSVPSLKELGLFADYHLVTNSRQGTLTPQEVEIKKLQLIVKNLSSKLSCEQRRNDTAESELMAVTLENKLLADRVRELQDNAHLIKRLEKELQDLENRSSGKNDVFCDRCKKCVDAVERFATVPEHDGECEIRHAELMKHQNGGSIYGSRESLQSEGVDKQDLSTYVAEEVHISLLSELDQQYHHLVQKYEQLLEAKGRRDSGKTDAHDQRRHKEAQVQTALTPRAPRPLSLPLPANFRITAMTLPSPGVEGEPEYKQLFREIFDTLRRTVEDQEGLTPVVAGSKSPLKPTNKRNGTDKANTSCK